MLSFLVEEFLILFFFGAQGMAAQQYLQKYHQTRKFCSTAATKKRCKVLAAENHAGYGSEGLTRLDLKQFLVISLVVLW